MGGCQLTIQTGALAIGYSAAKYVFPGSSRSKQLLKSLMYASTIRCVPSMFVYAQNQRNIFPC